MASEKINGEFFSLVKPADPTPGSITPVGTSTNPHRVAQYIWNPNTLAYELVTPSTGGSGSVSVTNFPATQPVSATSLPLPTGASTSAKQDTGNTSLASIDAHVIKADTDHVAVTSSALPAGAATEATLGNVAKDATVAGVAKDGTAITGQALEAGGASNNGWLSSIRKAITDRLGTLGQKTMAGSTPVAIASDQSGVPVTGAFFQATQPVSLAAAIDVSDRAVRLAGVVSTADGGQATVGAKADAVWDGASAASGVSIWKYVGQKIEAVRALLAATLSQNLAQVGGTAISAKALPVGASGQTALPVYHNAIQLLTYTFGARAIVTGALTANTAKAILSLEVAAGNTKTVKIRRILISGIQTTLLAGLLDIQLNRGSAASSAGTGVTAGVRVTGDAAPSTVVKTLPTIVAGTVLDIVPFAVDATAAVSAQPQTVLYDWQEGGETKPWTLKPGVIDSLVLMAISTAAQNWTLTIHITLTEES